MKSSELLQAYPGEKCEIGKRAGHRALLIKTGETTHERQDHTRNQGTRDAVRQHSGHSW